MRRELRAVKLISWNVNGIRAMLKKGHLKDVEKLDPDILCLQETKAHPEQVDVELVQYPHHFWNAAEKKGYSGTAVFSKLKPLHVSYGVGDHTHDKEGRVITLEFPKFYLVNVYTPNAGEGLKRLKYRMAWDEVFRKYVAKLNKKKPVVMCGDFNVAHQEIDLARPDSNHQNAGFTDEEREGFAKLLESGFIDSFRSLHPKKIAYSWWSYRTRARERNIGWRIDYFCLSRTWQRKLTSALIYPQILGSDHCPVGINLQ